MKIMYNVNVHVMDEKFSNGDAIAWENDRIVAVGKKENLFRKYTDDQNIDGHGCTLTPAFIDPHMHFLDGIIYQGALDCSPANAPTITDLKELLQKSAMHLEKDQWVVAQGYDPWAYPVKSSPTRHDLDEACPNHPVVIVHYSFHECIANSRALELANINKKTSQPFAGIIKKNIRGNPTGHLIETAMGKVMHQSKTDLIAQKRSEILQRIASFQETLWGLGITRIGDPAVTNSSRDLYQEAYDTGILKTPVFLYPCNEENMLELPEDKLSQPFLWENNELIKTGPMKFFLDGSDRAAMVLNAKQFLITTLMTILESIRSLSLTPIKISLRSPVKIGKDLKFHFGMVMAGTAQCQSLVSKAIEKDFSIAFHAIGNKAIQQAIDIIKQAAQHHKASPPAHIVHCLFLNNEIIRQINAIDAAVVTQPYFLSHMDRENVPYLSGVKQLPLRSMINEGIRVAGSSDWPVVSCDPLLGIERAVTRITKGDETLQEEEAITVREAFAMYTREAAHVLGCLDETGTLEPGKRADFILLSGNPLDKDTVQWNKVKVQKTFLDGKMMYS